VRDLALSRCGHTTEDNKARRFVTIAGLSGLRSTSLGRDSSVGIATRYGLDGPGIVSRWWRGFQHPSHTGPGAQPASFLYNGYRVSFPGVKRPGRGVDHPPSSSARVKERVELYLYSPSGHSWPVPGRTLPFITVLSLFTLPPAISYYEFYTIFRFSFERPLYFVDRISGMGSLFHNESTAVTNTERHSSQPPISDGNTANEYFELRSANYMFRCLMHRHRHILRLAPTRLQMFCLYQFV
jgi:hypothetical protein